MWNVVAILHLFLSLFRLLDVFFIFFDSLFRPCLVFKVLLGKFIIYRNGDCEIRTRDPLLARQVLSQLS